MKKEKLIDLLLIICNFLFLECRPVGDLGIGNGNVPDSRIKASGTEIGYNKNVCAS